MSRSSRLEPIAGLAKNREDNAAAAIGQTRQSLEAQERRLNELRQFQREYQERYQSLGQNGVNIQRINEYRRFNDKLSEAIQQQQRQLEETRRQLEQQNRSWSEANARRQVLDNTIDRFRSEESRHAGRREQRESDEHARWMRSIYEDQG